MLKIETIPVTPIEQNCRILYLDQALEAVVIDPGGDVEIIVNRLRQLQVSLSAIWLTHSHFDHCGGVAGLKEVFPVPLFAHSAGKDFRSHVRMSAMRFGGAARDMLDCPEPENFLNDGDRVQLGSEVFEVLFTPGHAPDHLAFYHHSSKTLIAGDAIFRCSIGRTDLPGGNYQLLIDSIRNKILTLDDDTKILPGHGPDTSVGYEKSHNPFLG